MRCNIISFFVVAVCITILFSCNNDIQICEVPTLVQSGIGFYHAVDSTDITDTLLPQLSIVGIGAADTLYNQTEAYSVTLPLNQNADSSRFIIFPDTTSIGDTVTLRYNRQPNFLSPGCGFVTFFTIDTVIATTHHIDSAVIENKSITNNYVENVKLYY
jgi:Family of unknown function (DUF6452)